MSDLAPSADEQSNDDLSAKDPHLQTGTITFYFFSFL